MGPCIFSVDNRMAGAWVFSFFCHPERKPALSESRMGRSISLYFRTYAAQRQINRKRNREPDEPRVIIKPDEERRDARCINDFHGDKKPRKIRQHRDEQ